MRAAAYQRGALDDSVNVIHKVNVVHETARVRRREAKAERILDAAEGILEREGHEALTMQRLAAELELTVGAAYRYFASKDAIVAALQRRVFEGLAADLERAIAEYEAAHPRASRVGALSRVCVVARVYATLPERRPTHARLLSRMMGEPRNVLPEGFGEANAQVAMTLAGSGVRELASAREAGALGAGDDLERAILLWTSLTGLAQAKKLERWGVPGLDVDALTERLVVTLLVGWGAEPARAREALARAAEIV
ncbi:TetR/AcrR family transcriptional regulator [Sandaracinus amylolyticus]|uniref:TetR/AcrR family transcriptional regulator n=1 Tax=Sandaracinus amylolyticus TaxID=927083 RepID=UPI001F285221|nr:TetR/AcrR family transcriptional regulator [Sandaracinus amylolyticus]